MQIPGNYNIAIGNDALAVQTSGTYNVAVGKLSQQSITTGIGCSMVIMLLPNVAADKCRSWIWFYVNLVDTL